MTVAGKNLRRLTDVVNARQETPIDVDGARLLEADLCHANGECFHSGNTVCDFCDGSGRVSLKARENYYATRQAERARLTPLKTVVLLGAVAVGLWTTLALANGVVLG